MKKIIFLCLLLGLIKPMYSQVSISVDGVVKHFVSEKKLDGVTITVEQDKLPFATFVTTSSGKFKFQTPLGSDYMIIFSKPGFVSKKVLVQTASIPEEDHKSVNNMFIEMTLFEDQKGMDFSLLENNPIGKAKYQKSTGKLDWDLAYTNSIKAKLDKMMAQFDTQTKIDEAKRKAEEAEAKRLAEEAAAKKAAEEAEAKRLAEEAAAKKAAEEAEKKKLAEEAAAKKAAEEAEKKRLAEEAAAKKAAEEAEAKRLAEEAAAKKAAEEAEKKRLAEEAAAKKAAEEAEKKKLAEEEAKRLAEEAAAKKAAEEAEKKRLAEEAAAKKAA
ncbi:MAG: hypothetical protein KJZ56_03045, partial [Flavobacteriales bacterium]|nr:hypothetical protein [Flavobacteriales bacterium]